MIRNLGRIDQFARIIIGLAFIAFAVKDGTLTPGYLAAGVIGLILLLTAFFSYCPLYTLLGVSTRGKIDRAT